jgi:hypothetical protein
MSATASPRGSEAWGSAGPLRASTGTSLSVSDSGLGIPEDQEAIFEEFKQVRTQFALPARYSQKFMLGRHQPPLRAHSACGVNAGEAAG